MRSSRPRQLRLVFADNSSEGKDARNEDGSSGREYLLHTASARKTTGLDAPAAAGDGGLLDRVASEPNLAQALLHVLRNHGAPGVDGKSVEEVVRHAPALLPRLRRELLSGRYRPGDIRRVWIPKPGGGRRGLGIPNVVDRWVSQAVLLVLEPIFEPTFHDGSHGFRPRRGAGTALADVRTHLSEGFTWIVSVDLSSFFDHVNHQRLLARMGRQVKDGRVLALVQRMLKAKVELPGGVRMANEEGTPQGHPLSPLLSNIVLDELDGELQRRGLRFVRYADDINVFVRSERAGGRVLDSLTRFLEGRMRLTVNRDKSGIVRPETSHILGFSFRVEPDGQVDVLLSDKTIRRMSERIQALTPRTWGRSLEDLLHRTGVFLKGWMGYYRQCSAASLRTLLVMDAHIRRRIRAILVLQKGRRPRFLYRHLRGCGVSVRAAARAAWASCGPWPRSNRPGLTRAYPNAWFHARLVSLATEWHRHNPPAQASGQRLLFAP